MSQPELTERAKRVRLILLDVDGVLTDGRIFFVPDGEGGVVESKSFDVVDGAGIACAHRAGLQTGIISGRESPAVTARADELGIKEVHQGIRDKAHALERVVQRTRVEPENICFAGDDIVDLPVMRRVGFPIAVANAPEEVRAHAAYVTSARGGRGAVREIVELILRAQGKWDEIVAEFLK
jgi:3-deoxy-D-manno-octulosonate 8-phosphate phosphatase (KDO 8-P phosphatase)